MEIKAVTRKLISILSMNYTILLDETLLRVPEMIPPSTNK